MSEQNAGNGPAVNTDVEIWRGPDEGNGDFYADNLFITKDGALGINCGGYVTVLPVREWHRCAYITQLQTPLCLGAEYKMANGEFQWESLQAFGEAYTKLGEHRGLTKAIKAFSSAPTAPGREEDTERAAIINWAEMMRDHSPLTDCKPWFARIATYLRSAVPSETDEPFSDQDLAKIDWAWEQHKAAKPVAKIINDNQAGRTAIVEILCEPPTLCVGTVLFAEPASTLSPSSAHPAQRPVVSVQRMELSGDRTDYFVSIKVGDREVTPHVFREEYKAAYHVALYDWLLNGTGTEPDVVKFNPEDFPAQRVSAHPSQGLVKALAIIDAVNLKTTREEWERLVGAGKPMSMEVILEEVKSALSAQGKDDGRVTLGPVSLTREHLEDRYPPSTPRREG